MINVGASLQDPRTRWQKPHINNNRSYETLHRLLNDKAFETAAGEQVHGKEWEKYLLLHLSG